MKKIYNHSIIEKGIYDFWKKNQFFRHAKSSEIFSTILPPPNVTGNLHLGHAWDGVLPDFLMRYNHLLGKNSIWYPGKDHAGIATQSKVENVLIKTQNKNRHDLGRNKFIEEVRKFSDNSALTIEKQWSKLGLTLTYGKEKFTMDEDVNKLVNKTFVDYYKQGLIYQDYKLVNWDIELQTVISDIEVEHKEVEGNLYYIKYILEDNKDKYLEVATTRPETMFADVAIFVNPKDKRYLNFKGKKVINPSNGQLIPILFDDYVDMEFGTGALKVTPGHDFNDYELGIKHKLEKLSCILKDGTMNELANKFEGKDRLIVRKEIISEFKKNDILLKIEKHDHQVGHSSRSNAIIEPMVSKQWYLKFPQETIDQLKKMIGKEFNFYPKRFNDTFIKWMDNIHEWCISRQLWWGHQLPVWYNDNSDNLYVGEKEPEDIKNWTRDEDVLDTWFSSSLWPIATTELNNDNKTPLTSLMVTGYDLIFFWVSKMALQSIQLRKQLPFKDVLLHGMFKDEKGQKMSKSKGNGIDPMDIIEKYGSDSLRFFLLSNTTPGLDLNFNQQKINDAWNFNNKIWNIARFIEMKVKNKKLININESDLLELDKYILNKYNNLLINITKNINEYEISKTAKNVYDFIYNEFANFYLEMIKHNLENNNRQDVLFYIFNKILILLHPYLPMITENIYQSLMGKESILKETLESFKLTKSNKINKFEIIKEILFIVRSFKSYENLDPKEKILINMNIEELKEDIIKFLNKDIEWYEDKTTPNKIVTLSDKTILNIYIKEKEIDVKKIRIQIKHMESEIDRSNKMLNNPGFIKKAPKSLIKIEEDKIRKNEIELNKLKQLIK